MRDPALPQTLRRKPPRVLIVGREGQLARALHPAFRAAGWEATALGRPLLDLAGPVARVAEVVDVLRPALVVNAAGWTDAAAAEERPEAAMAVNRDGAAMLAALVAARQVPLIHVSTAAVFGAGPSGPHAEADPVAPLGALGRSKLAGERAVLAENPRALVLRTAWICSATGRNVLRAMLAQAAARDEVAVVADQHGAPIFATDLAEAIAHLAPSLIGEAPDSPAFGVFHLAGAPDTTWYGFAQAIFTGLARRGHRIPRLRAIGAAESPAHGRHPVDSRLDCSRILAVHGLARPSWQRSLEATLDHLLGPAPGAMPDQAAPPPASAAA